MLQSSDRQNHHAPFLLVEELGKVSAPVGYEGVGEDKAKPLGPKELLYLELRPLKRFRTARQPGAIERSHEPHVVGMSLYM